MHYRPARRETRVSATLLVDDQKFAARILDISRDGARIRAPATLLAGTAVYLQLEDTWIPAVIHWSRDQQLGMRFLDRLDRDTLVMIENASDDLNIFR